MTVTELTSCLDALVGNESVPQRFSASLFADRVLGFEDYEADADDDVEVVDEEENRSIEEETEEKNE